MKPAAASRLERLAYMARAIVDLSRDLDHDESGSIALAILELATTIHDTLDHEIRRSGDPGIGYLDAVPAQLDERRANTLKLRAAT